MSQSELVRPTSPWLGEVMAAAAASVGVPLGGASDFGLPEARSVIVIVVDGLGWASLLDHRGHVPTLRPFLQDSHPVNTCLPSTTAAALTALTTGALPGESRMVGYSVAEGDGVMNLLNFAPGVDSSTWQPVPTYFERLAHTGVRPAVVSASKFMGSGFTLASLRGAEFYGAPSLGERFAVARRLAQEQPSLIYLYWSEVDHAGHRYGTRSDQWLGELEDLDRTLGAFLRKPPENTTVLLTADHGMVDVEQRIDIAEIPALAEGVRILAGEGRSVHVHATAGQGAAVRDRWSNYLGDRAVVLAPQDLASVIGDGPGAQLVGDAMVFLRGRSVIVDSRIHSASMIGQEGVHGSFSDEELLVPVLVLG